MSNLLDIARTIGQSVQTLDTPENIARGRRLMDTTMRRSASSETINAFLNSSLQSEPITTTRKNDMVELTDRITTIEDKVKSMQEALKRQRQRAGAAPGQESIEYEIPSNSQSLAPRQRMQTLEYAIRELQEPPPGYANDTTPGIQQQPLPIPAWLTGASVRLERMEDAVAALGKRDAAVARMENAQRADDYQSYKVNKQIAANMTLNANVETIANENEKNAYVVALAPNMTRNANLGTIANEKFAPAVGVAPLPVPGMVQSQDGLAAAAAGAVSGSTRFNTTAEPPLQLYNAIVAPGTVTADPGQHDTNTIAAPMATPGPRGGQQRR